MDPTGDEFSAALLRCAVLWRTSLDERLRPWGATYASWRTLRVLVAKGQRLHQTSLAKEIGVETPTLVALLDRMEKMDWLRRRPDPDDRRVRWVEITPQGQKVWKKLDGEAGALRRKLFGVLSPDEVRLGVALLEKVIAAAGKV